MICNRTRTAFAACACAAIILSAPVKAADVQSSAAETTLGEIVVTAQKREQRLIDVPAPVTALSATDLLDQNKTRLTDYFRDVPGLAITQSGSGMATVSVRGITTGNTTNPTVGITIDDVPYGSVSGLALASYISPPDLDPSDLQRIEVLRGPQGTLYGASSLGGLLKFVTVDPSFTAVSGRVEIGGDKINHGGTGGTVRGALNLPVVPDVLAIRASGFIRRDGGFIDDPVHGLSDVDSGQSKGGHFAALLKMGDTATLKLSALYQQNRTDGQSQIDSDYFGNPQFGDLGQDRPPGTGKSLNKVRMYTANLTVELPADIHLVSLTGFSRNDWISVMDFSSSFGPLLGTGAASVPYDFWTNRLSQELRLERPGSVIDWTAGVFWARERSGDHVTIASLDPVTGAVVDGTWLDENDRFRYTEYAGFVSATWHITQALNLEGGLRYASNKQNYVTDLEGPLGGGYVFNQASSDHAVTFSLNPSYKIADGVLAYIRVASGYRPGGPNAGVFGAGTPITYNADKTVNYEVGLNAEAFDRRLTFTGSVYYVRWSGIQIGGVDPATGFLYFQNGNSASSKGVELAVNSRPWTGATLTASATLGRAELTADLPGTAALGHSGDRLPNTPETTFSLDFEQTFPLSGKLSGFAGGSANYVGNRLGIFVGSAPAGQARFPMGAYFLGGLRAGIRSDNGWNGTLHVSNIGNTRAVLSGGTRAFTSEPSQPFGATIVQPRTVGISISKSF